MSGTSADGVSAALGDFHDRCFKLLGSLTHAYPKALTAQIRGSMHLNAGDLSRLNVELGLEFAKAAKMLLKKVKVPASKVVCIGSHGQTVYHGPHDLHRNTFQIADPFIISEQTGIPVVSQFRQGDIAVGGEGAPLIPFFDHVFFGHDPVHAQLNIGGISNVSIVGKGVTTPLAFDTGPGNGLMDRAIQVATGGAETHDHNGARAKVGAIDMDAVSKMVENAYFKKGPPKSTGPETFGMDFITQHLGPVSSRRIEDVLATLNYLTCITIQEAFRNFIFPSFNVQEVVVSGGGVHNKTLIKKLECLFAPIPVTPIDKKGLPSQAKEPLAFAFFGLRCMQRKPNHLPACTGAKRRVILGSITRP